MKNHLHRVFTLAIIAFVFILVSATVGMGQEAVTDGSTPLGLSPGAPAGSYALSDFENVNLFNGSLNFALPILKVGGRGGAGYAITLRIDQKWLVHKEPYDGQPPINYYYPTPNWWSEEALQRTYGVGRLSVRQGGSRNFVIKCGSYVHESTLTRLTFTAPDGTEYELRDQLTNGKPDYPTCTTGFNRGKVFVTADGSAATFISDTDVIDYPFDNPANIPGSGYMMLKDGTRFRIQSGSGRVEWMRDRNGNKISFVYDAFSRLITVKDSLNREVSITYAASIPGYDQITIKGFGGAQRTIKIHLKKVHNALRSDYAPQTEAQLFPELNGAAGTGSGNPEIVSAVELPNGKQYQFLYNSYSELARVVLPTGGAIEYDWTAGLTDSISGSGVLNTYPADKVIYRRVIERRVYPDGGAGGGYSSKMTYSRPESSTTNAGYLIADQYDSAGALKTREQHYFHGSARASFWIQPTQYSPWQDGKEYLTKTFASNGTTLLRQVSHTFAQRAPVSWWTGDAALAPPNDTRIIESVSTLSDLNLVSKQTFGYDDSVPYNNQNSVKEYHFGTGVPGALARETKTTFITSSTYTGNSVHLRSLPSQVSVYEGTTERARTTFEYDNYTTTTNHAPLTPRSSISGLDSAFTTGYTTRGNVTATTRYLLTNGAVTGSISNYSQFDIAGNTVKAIDGLGYITTLHYDDRFGTPDGNAQFNSAPLELSSVGQASYAFATRIVNHLNHNSYSQFDYYAGKPVDGEDANGVVASGYYNDALDRPTQVVRAVGTSVTNQTTFAYDDTNRIITTTSDFDSLNDPTPVKSQTLYDGLGRTKETRQYEGGTNYITVQTQFDALGRAFKTSNTFRPWQSETAVWTTSEFDALGRVISVTTPDNAVVGTSYSGNTVMVTDQTGKDRQSTTDALGRLTQVVEDPGTGGLGYVTTYSYDVLDNLMSVTQGAQSRTFIYDSLKRLKSAVNPESGTINYTYDDNGNLLTKTDARSISTTYVYDALNRNTTVNYSNTTVDPDITRNYDGAANGIGRLWGSYAGGAETAGTTVEHMKIQTYDELGRPLDQRQRFRTNSEWSGEYQTQRTYNRAGSVLTQTYPSQRIVKYAYDEAGRSSSFTGNLGDGAGRNYATNITYSSFGGLTREQFGTATPLYHKQHFNIRGQLYDMRLSTVNDAVNWNRGAIINYYSFQPYGFGTSGPDNNGNLLVQQHWIPNDDAIGGSSFMQQNYGYDALNRINWVGEYQDGATNTGNQNFTYDRWGNRTISSASGTGINNKPFTVNTSNNRLGVPSGQSGTMSYDAAGNLTTDTYSGSAVTRAYDAENRMTSETQSGSLVVGIYAYNADGQRVRRKVNGVETWPVYGMDGELLAEYAANGAAASPQKEYGYRNGELLVIANAPVAGGGPNVAWTNAVGVSTSGNNLTKTAATGWGNAGAASTQSIVSGDGYMEFTVTGTSNAVLAGLSNGDTNQTYQEVDFAIHPWNGTIYIYEAGISRGTFGTYATGDVLRVAVEGGVVKYRKNGALLYTSSVAPTYPLLVDATLYSINSTLDNVVLVSTHTQVTWTNAVGVSTSGNNLTKTAATGWGNAGAASTQSIVSGDGYMEFTVTGTSNAVLAGLSNGDTNQTYQEVDFAIHPWNGTIYIYEAGISRGTFGTYATGDVLRVAVEGGVVKYRKNGTLLYTSTVTPTYPLLVDTSLYSNGSTLNTVVINGSSNATINWLVTDHLGTPRIIADETGSLAGTRRHDYLPFGEELFAGTGGRTIAKGYSGDAVRQKFTSKERDNETGLDYFLARYYSSAQGRFTSPDEFTGGPDELYYFANEASANPTFYADLNMPQSLNKYQYSYNNPLKYIDPDGHDALLVTNKDTGETTLVIPVNFTGAGATPELIAEITNRASQLDTGGSGVKIEVVPTDKPINGVLNSLDLSQGLDYKKYPGAGEGVNRLGGNQGHINTNGKGGGGAAVHDILHFAGMKDKYKEGPKDKNGQRTSVPKKGYDNSNIMTARGGTKLKPEQIKEAKENKSTKKCTTAKGKTVCK